MWLGAGCDAVSNSRDGVGGGHVGIVRYPILGEHGVTGGVAVVDEEASVVGVPGMERHSEQALLPRVAYQGGDVEEWDLCDPVGVHDPNPAVLGDHEASVIARARK